MYPEASCTITGIEIASSVNGVCTIASTPAKAFAMLPISHAAVGIEDALGQLLLERMLLDLGLVDRDTQSWFRIGPHNPPGAFHGEPFLDDILPPGDIG